MDTLFDIVLIMTISLSLTILVGGLSELGARSDKFKKFANWLFG